jgi:signal transduction histidine kinase
MKSVNHIRDQWVAKNHTIFAGITPSSFFINSQKVELVVNYIMCQPQKLADLVPEIIHSDREFNYSPVNILRSLDQLYELIKPLSEKQSFFLYQFRDNLVQAWFDTPFSKSSDGYAKSDHWENDVSTPTPPDIYKILGDILNLLLKITSSDQAYLYLADFPYQTYNPFMTSGNLTKIQMKAFYEESLRPDTDILLSDLIKRGKNIVIYPGEINNHYPSYLYKRLEITHALALPIQIDNRMLGFIILNIDHAASPLPFPQELVKTCESITGAMALALENSRLYEITNQRLAESQSINQITLAMLQSFQLNEVLDMICDNAIALTQGIGSTVHLLQNNQKILKRASYSGFLIHPSVVIPLNDSVLRTTLNNSEPIIINRSLIDQRLPDGSKFSVLAIPLSVHQQPVGILDIIKKRNQFTPDDIRIIKIFADQAAIAIEHANLYQQAGLAAKHDERQKMARNLHDSVNQNLYAILLYSRTIKKLILADKKENALETLDQLKNTTKEALNDLRIFIHELRPSILEEEGLVIAIQRRLESVEEKLGFDVHFASPEVFPEISMDLQEGFYRITQEALNNIVKHAKADKINVNFSFSDGVLSLRIEDNGIGYNNAIKRGFGLKSMQERANLMNAKLNLKSKNNTGTLVEVEVKL